MVSKCLDHNTRELRQQRRRRQRQRQKKQQVYISQTTTLPSLRDCDMKLSRFHAPALRSRRTQHKKFLFLFLFLNSDTVLSDSIQSISLTFGKLDRLSLKQCEFSFKVNFRFVVIQKFCLWQHDVTSSPLCS